MLTNNPPNSVNLWRHSGRISQKGIDFVPGLLLPSPEDEEERVAGDIHGRGDVEDDLPVLQILLQVN